MAPVLLVAATLVDAAGVDIAYVDVRAIIDTSPQAEAARQRLEREFAPRDREIAARRGEIRKLESEFARDATALSEAQRRRRQAELRALERERRRMRAWFLEDLNVRRRQELATLQRRVTAVVGQVAEEEGYDLVLSNGIGYASGEVDITDEVMRRLAVEYRGAAN